MATLLVVEDDRDVLALLRAVLEEAAHVVRTASTRRHAEEIITRGGLDLIITDAVLQDGADGGVVGAALTVGVPVLMISGDGEKIAQLRARAVPCLQKPFRGSALVELVDRLLADA